MLRTIKLGQALHATTPQSCKAKVAKLPFRHDLASLESPESSHLTCIRMSLSRAARRVGTDLRPVSFVTSGVR